MSALGEHLADAVAQYRIEARAAAVAEARHKAERAKRFLKALHEGEAKSAVMADNIAEADGIVAGLYSDRLITAALADATKEKLRSLREEMATARTQAVNERELDRFHAHDKDAA